MQTPPHQSWNLTWDRCVVEPTCDDLPDPDPSSGLRRKGDGAAVDVVKMGHSVVYECINRTLYQERDIYIYTVDIGYMVHRYMVHL